MNPNNSTAFSLSFCFYFAVVILTFAQNLASSQAGRVAQIYYRVRCDTLNSATPLPPSISQPSHIVSCPLHTRQPVTFVKYPPILFTPFLKHWYDCDEVCHSLSPRDFSSFTPSLPLRNIRGKRTDPYAKQQG